MTPRSHDPAIENRGPQTHVQPLRVLELGTGEPGPHAVLRRARSVRSRNVTWTSGHEQAGKPAPLRHGQSASCCIIEIEDAGAAVIGAGVPHGQVEVGTHVGAGEPMDAEHGGVSEGGHGSPEESFPVPG